MMIDGIAQHWVHSHEEDSDTETVFRPSTYAFPLSRGRSGFDLRVDGSCTDFDIAPSDGVVEADGHWRLDGDTLILMCETRRAEPRQFQVVSCTPDRLVVSRSPVD